MMQVHISCRHNLSLGQMTKRNVWKVRTAVTSPTNDAQCKKWPKLSIVLLKPLYSATCRRCKVSMSRAQSLKWHWKFEQFDPNVKFHVWPHFMMPLTMIRVPALWLMQVSYLQRKKVDGAKFKVTQSVRGGLAGGRHKMWRQKPEEPSSRGAPTQLFLTLEHWIYPTCTLHHQIYLLSDGRVGKMWSLLVSQLCHFLLMVRNPNFGDKKVPYFNVSWQKVPLGDLVSKRHPDP